MNKEQQLKLLEESRDSLQNQIDELNNEKIDFSKFVGVYNNILIIKGETQLKGYVDGDIMYTKGYIDMSTPNYIYTTVGELERGDVFIREDDVENMELESFNVYVNKGAAQFLKVSFFGEMMDWYKYTPETKVIKFLRT